MTTVHLSLIYQRFPVVTLGDKRQTKLVLNLSLFLK